MKANLPQHHACEQNAKHLQERIMLVEKHFADLYTSFGAYSRKIAGLRDKNDAVADAIFNFSEAENINICMKGGLLHFSKTLKGVGDYRDIQIQRLETNVVSEFSQYEKLCKHAREELKSTIASQDREAARKKQLDRLRERNPQNRPQITAAQVELSKASMDLANNIKWLNEQMDHFERKKLQDIRSLLLTYVCAELSFHVKAVELFSKGYREIANMDVDTDLKEFNSFLHDPESSSRLEMVKETSLRWSISNLFSTPPSTKHSEPKPIKDKTSMKSKRKSESVCEFEDELSVASQASDTSQNH